MKKSSATSRQRPAGAKPQPPGADESADPELREFLDRLDHPLKRELTEAGRIILGASPEIHAGIKWNAPSYRTTDWFATTNLRSRDRVQFVFHLGAKAKKIPGGGLKISDPDGLIKWLAPDRCLVTLAGEPAIHRAALTTLVRAWLRYL